MNATIIDLREHLQQERSMTDRREESDAMRRRKQDRAEQRLKRNTVLLGSDPKRMAQYISKLMNEVANMPETRRGWRTEFAAGLSWCREVKYLDRFTFPDGLGAEQEKRRLKRLAHKPKHYADLARELARRLDRDPRGILVELCQGTQLDADREENGTIDLEDGDWDRLVELIEEMTEAIVRRTGMQEHLRQIGTRSGRYDLALEAILPSSGLLLPHGPLVANYELSDEFPPVPSILLYEELKTPRFEQTLHIAEDNVPLMERSAIPVEVAIWREVRLAIGPANERETAHPLFEVRTRVELKEKRAGKDDAFLRIRRPWFYVGEGCREAVEVITDEGSFRGEIDFDPPPTAISRLPREPSLFSSSSWLPLEGEAGSSRLTDHPRMGLREPIVQPEHVYAVWFPVNAASCKAFLDWQRVPGALEVRFELPAPVHTKLPEAAFGAAVEAALVDAEHALEIKLEAEATRLIELVKGHLAEKRDRVSEQHERARKRWRDD